MFIKNAWYVACRPEEVQDKPLGRKICGENIVFYRGHHQQVFAVEDFCPHRGAPLSLGYVENGELVCGYHGLVMGCEGKTVSMPGQRVNGFPCNKTFAVIEKFGFIWIWPGNKDEADVNALPELEWADNPEWGYGGGLFHIHCDYKLMIDNLMDLTHETYVHASSIGQKEIDEAAPTTKVEGDHVITERYMENIYAPPFWQMALRGNYLPDEALIDRWQRCHFYAPSNVHIEVGVALAGHGGYDAPKNKKVSAVVVDFITPETETSHWYFWGMARNFQPDNPELTSSIREGQGKIFTEDLEMLERQQQNILNYPNRKLLMLNIDAGGVQSRKIIDRLLDAEKPTLPTSGQTRQFPNIRII
ncbi:aromatic ring-hydroxylating dioxygenase subunit alpha [Acinetobacter qingfengensis]|uniref:Rieske (2Fe-2S) protein n=1 Tax=Acinetobacter qingfengensis TaxID=1262585 RepID=A0A1E7QWL6_9GAMM|nr:aromatic ring-hydroxylating dioxygenase subunit alpha [Acinetobacter qingfengensis]KAA8731253.1 aromatic ring-hydroxylating dioxygenase subunit alpha [Acinetobacter qingfengensis]OEY91500.1 Rieske (2Fe-2S) protein [Acinetobacter qingfengensis]